MDITQLEAMATMSRNNHHHHHHHQQQQQESLCRPRHCRPHHHGHFHLISGVIRTAVLLTVFRNFTEVVVDGFIIQHRHSYRPSIPTTVSLFELPRRPLSKQRPLLPLMARPSSSDSNKNSNKGNSNSDDQKKLTNAERERREEERRRKERKDDVVINRTSARRGEQDYPLEPDRTREEWLRQASAIEQKVFLLTEEGLEALKSLQLEKADEAFDKVFDLKPQAYLWQAGIVKFYLNDLKGAASILARNAKLFEKNPIMGPATEERIWRDACQLKFLSTLPTAERKQILRSPPDSPDGINSIFPQIIDDDDDDGNENGDEQDDPLFSTSVESRKVFRLARELFTSSIYSNPTAEALARGQLRSLGGSFDEIHSISPGKPDKKMRKLTAWFFLGLHYDVIGEQDEATKCMKMAMHFSTNAGGRSDLIQTLPLLHMTVRDWFDDDDFEEDPWKDTRTEDDTGIDVSSSSLQVRSSEKTKGLFLDEYETDPVFEATVLEDLKKMTIIELRDALRIRGLKIRGSKQELTERLFYSMMDDSGYQSGFQP